MKWKNFQRLLRRNPELKHVLGAVVGWATLSNGSKSTIDEFEKLVEFIRIRPLNSAVLDETTHYKQTETECAVRQCRVFYHFEGGRLPYDFNERGSCMTEDNETVQQLLARCVEEQQQASYRITHWGQKIVLDFVMVNSVIYQNDGNGQPLDGTRRENVDLYRVPADYSLLAIAA